jgi:hypothetical protein
VPSGRFVGSSTTSRPALTVALMVIEEAYHWKGRPPRRCSRRG